MHFRDVEVVCHEGHRSRERPAWVVVEGFRRRVVEVVDRWYQSASQAGQPNLSYFRVRLEDGEVILLRYVPLFDRWGLVLPRSPQAEEDSDEPDPPKAVIIPFRPKK